MGASLVSAGNMVDYTPGSDVTAGTVVVQDELVGVANLDIPSGKLGAITVLGVFDFTKTTGAISAGADLWWDATNEYVATENVGGTHKYIGKAVKAAASGDSTVRVLLGTTQADQGLTNVIADPGDAGAIAVTESGSVSIVSGGAETRTLAAPTFVGQLLNVGFKTDGGDCVITAAAGVNQTGNNTITGADAGDQLLLVAVYLGTALVWRIACNDGWALSTV